ncbi:MAG: hypothetical protein JNJ70_20455 [Verrucomicrobiales bacterium]|nr:hypothetical protein [Verrucomicrobiales bacterium]
MNLRRYLSVPVLILAAFAAAPAPAEAGRFSHCEYVDDYKPAKGVLKLWTVPIKTEWEHRHHCLPCGRKLPYKVKVITYRERYTDGTQRTWKCVVAGSEISLGK